jgi:regulatory protein
MIITAIEPQVHDTERINLFVDGRFLLGVNAALVIQMALEVGQELLPEQVEQLHYEERLQQAVDRAYNFLSYRPRSRAEVRRYLLRKETPPDIIDAAMARLDRYDLVNDRSFATFWIENREQFSPRGVRAIKNELRMKGVDRDVVDELIEDEEEKDEELALRAARKKALSLTQNPSMDFNTFRNRLGSFLQRRGFNYDVSKRTVRQLWEELRSDDENDV